MTFQSSGPLRYYTFPLFDGKDICHGILTRHGGVSPSPWFSLNVGGTVGDDPARVQYNRGLIFNALDRDLTSAYEIWQVHSSKVIYGDKPLKTSNAIEEGDIVLTDNPEGTIFMRFADCVPVLLYDPRQRVVGMVHAGWRGTVKNAAGEAIQAMKDRYGCHPENILAGIGPSIGPDHYQVGEDVVSLIQDEFKDEAPVLIHDRKGHKYLDLWFANRLQLVKAGVRQIEISGICTACEVEDWFSHRAEQGRTGRFGALIALSG